MSDATFVPSATALSVVGLTAEEITSDRQVVERIKSNLSNIDSMDYQTSVLVYVLVSRGHDYAHILATTGLVERTAIRRMVEGKAILRTGETHRTVKAIRKGALSDGAVEAATTSTRKKEEKIANLEQAAFVTSVTKTFEPVKGESITEDTMVALFTAAREAVADNEQPVNAATLVAAVPDLAEAAGLRVKQRTPQETKRQVLGLEAHCKAALADLQKIAKDAEADYVPTPQDVQALLALAQYVGIGLDLEPDMAAAIDALAG